MDLLSSIPAAVRIVSLAIATFVAIADPADACGCAGNNAPCDAAWKADAVFIGTARTIEHRETANERGPIQRTAIVRFDVERSFINATPRQLEIETFGGGNTCGFTFVNGERYLVYAWKKGRARYTTDKCSRTRSLADAAEDLAYLTAIPPPDAGGRVYGRAYEFQRAPFELTGIDYGPMAGLAVNVRGDGFSRDTVTDANGRYEFTGLPNGRLIVTVVAPGDFDARYLERPIRLTGLRACSQEDFQLRRIAGAYGTVVDGAGRPLAGIKVEALAAKLAGHLPKPSNLPVVTDAQGRFEFEDLPPGEYVFGVNLTMLAFPDPPPGPATFFPGTSRARDATVFELKATERKDVGTLRLTNRR